MYKLTLAIMLMGVLLLVTGCSDKTKNNEKVVNEDIQVDANIHDTPTVTQPVLEGTDKEEEPVCVNEYIEAEVINVNSQGIRYLLRQVKDFDQIGAYNIPFFGKWVRVQAVYDGEWDYVENHIETPGENFSVTDIPYFFKDGELELEYTWYCYGELPPGKYRAISRVEFMDPSSGRTYLDQRFYISFEFEIA